jgi:hypothetical protein
LKLAETDSSGGEDAVAKGSPFTMILNNRGTVTLLCDRGRLRQRQTDEYVHSMPRG